MLSRPFAALAACLVAALMLTAGVVAAQTVSDDLKQALATVPVVPGSGLLQPREGGERAASDAVADGPILRRRASSVNVDYLARMVAAKVAFTAEGNVSPDAAAFSLTLLPDVTIHVVKKSAGVDELGNTVWLGVPVEGDGSVTLVIHDGRVTGEIRLEDRKFGIAPTAVDHAVVEYRASGKWQREDVPLQPAPAPQATSGSGAVGAAIERQRVERPSATPSISVMIVYTAAALVQKPDMQGAIGLALADLRTTFSNSRITATVTLAGSAQTSYVELENESSDEILNDAMIGAGDFARIRQLQRSANADILSVWADYRDNCGLASGRFYDGDPGQVDLADAAYASVNTISAICDADTFTHEVGHLLGANHERDIVANAVPGPAGYNYGYVDLGRFRDVMAYGNACDNAGRPCPSTPYFSNPNVTYQGRPMGVADSRADAADNARKITEVLPYVAQLHSFFAVPTQPVLTIARTGRGRVQDTDGLLNCGTFCNAALDAGTTIRLTAIAEPGWDFTGWSGGCTGTGTCTVRVSASTTISATFAQSTVVQIGGVNSTAQTVSLAFLRFYNNGASAGTVTVTLLNATTGAVVTRWTSGAIAPGTAQQVAVGDIETAGTPAVSTKPQYYTASIDSQFDGYTQYVLWNPSQKTFTNLSTCSSGAKADANTLISVHTGTLFADYPSSVVIYNAGSRSTTVTLGIYEQATGTRRGTFQSDSIAAGGERIYGITTIEQRAGITPAADLFHYIIKPDTAYTGHLSHLVKNVTAGVFADLTTVCPLRAPAAVAAVSRIQQASVFSSGQSTSRSFLRFFNTGTNYAAVNVTISDPDSGVTLAQYASPTLNAGARLQVEISEIENAATRAFSKPDFYTASISGNMNGEFQHVLWNSANGSITNLTTCDSGTRNNPWRMAAVHTSRLTDIGYPSTIVVTNTGRSATRVSLDVADPETGTVLGTYQTASIPAGGQVLLPVRTIETGASPQVTHDGRSHYVITAAPFSGYLQHQVNNAAVSVVTDMTATCGIQP